jgi:hypothetical protein
MKYICVLFNNNICIFYAEGKHYIKTMLFFPQNPFLNRHKSYINCAEMVNG